MCESWMKKWVTHTVGILVRKKNNLLRRQFLFPFEINFMGKIFEPNKNAEYGSILTRQSVLCSFVAVNLFQCCRLYDILFFIKYRAS